MQEPGEKSLSVCLATRHMSRPAPTINYSSGEPKQMKISPDAIERVASHEQVQSHVLLQNKSQVRNLSGMFSTKSRVTTSPNHRLFPRGACSHYYNLLLTQPLSYDYSHYYIITAITLVFTITRSYYYNL